MAKVVRKYKLYKNGVFEGIYFEGELAKRFKISVSTLRERVINRQQIECGYTAEIAQDESLKEKGQVTDPKMIELLKEWDEVRMLFLQSKRT